MSTWLKTPPNWTNDLKTILLEDTNPPPDPSITLTNLCKKSAEFPVDFPIESVRCCQLKHKVDPKTLERNINSAYPVIHEHALFLCAVFLMFQKKSCDFYKNMSLIGFVDRLLSKRAVVFLGRQDHFRLLDGSTGSGNWESRRLEDCLSYDEIKLSALLSVSSYSYFINDGDRFNRGVFEKDRGKVEESGVIIGVIGPRFEKPEVMEYRDVIKSREQNVEKYGYGSGKNNLQKEFLKFYDGLSGTYDSILEEVKGSPQRYLDLGRDKYFDKDVYEKRLALSIDTLLIEANQRAKQANKKAFVHIVGLGLGVWRITQQQDQIFMDLFIKRLELLSETITNISDVRFSYISAKTAGNYKHGDQLNNITLHMTTENPQIRLEGDDEGKLLVVTYPWDGNAHPGNEFWGGDLTGSGDPAAASSSQIAELHNWHINERVRGRNLMVATFKGLVTFKEYQDAHREQGGFFHFVGWNLWLAITRVLRFFGCGRL